jgi:1-phosphofructokinase family hexose kinase
MIVSVCPNPSVDTFITLDRFVPGEVHRVQAEERFPGGKGVHVAMAAAELGEEVTLLAFWGGSTGRWLRRACDKLGIACAGPTLVGDSRTCLTLLAPGEYNHTEILGMGPKVSNSKLAAFHETFVTHAAAAADGGVITMSGSWPAGSPPTAYSDLLVEAKRHHVPVLLDTTGPALAAAIEHHPRGVHLNRSEAAAAFNEPDPAKAAALLAKHCDLAVVTDGPRGAYFSIDSALYHGHCTITPTASTVGSGDCLMAGIAIALQHRQSAKDIVAMACAAGAANCLRRELGMLHRTDVERLLPQVQVRKLS